MGIFLNNVMPYDKYKTVAEGLYFVDKTAILEELLPLLRQEQRFVCITRPRRFGKTIMANMIGAFFGKARECHELFDTLEIAKSKQYQKHLNKHDVIYVDFSELPKKCDNYGEYVARIEDGIYQDLEEAYPEMEFSPDMPVWDLLSRLFEKTQKKFIFVLDEWDAIFHMPFMTEKDKQRYLLFLKLLLKGRSYVELAYITGILPIAKYSSGSELNVFLEYDMATKIKFSQYFGFSDAEVDELYRRYVENTKNPQIARKELAGWYDGYHTACGERLYNPRSVVCALTDNQLSNYWTSSGPYDEIFFYIRNDVEHIRDDLALMLIGEGVDARMVELSAAGMELKTKDQVYSAMVMYGLLTFDDGRVFIPNKELMLKYEELLRNESSLGYIYRLARESERMLQATLAGDTDTMAQILQYAHNTETPILSYNHEVELAAIVNLVYLSARDKYQVEREDKAGKGFVDFIFYPLRQGGDGMILELKVDDVPEAAVRQIKEKDYALCFHGRTSGTSGQAGRILAVGISYDRETKEHACVVEEL